LGGVVPCEEKEGRGGCFTEGGLVHLLSVAALVEGGDAAEGSIKPRLVILEEEDEGEDGVFSINVRTFPPCAFPKVVDDGVLDCEGGVVGMRNVLRDLASAQHTLNGKRIIYTHRLGPLHPPCHVI